MNLREKKIEDLQSKARELSLQARALLEEERNEIQRPILRKSIGKCFKYMNSYGSGECRPLYVRIIYFNEKEMTFDTIQFQHTTARRVEIEYRKQYNFDGENYFANKSYEPISLREYEKARATAMEFIRQLLA